MIDSFSGEHYYLSNFYPHDGKRTIHHFYNCLKTDHPMTMLQILFAPTPIRAIQLGKSVVVRPYWNDVRLHVMEYLLRKKFEDTRLRGLLLATAPDVLINGNDWGEEYWGQVDGDGLNYLGHLLMEIRDDPDKAMTLPFVGIGEEKRVVELLLAHKMPTGADKWDK